MPTPPFLPGSFLSSVQASSYLELASSQLRSLDISSKLFPQNSGRFPSRKVSHRLIRVLPVANVVAFSSSWACMPQEGTRIRKPGRKARGVVVFSKTGEHRHDYTPTEDRKKEESSARPLLVSLCSAAPAWVQIPGWYLRYLHPNGTKNEARGTCRIPGESQRR